MRTYRYLCAILLIYISVVTITCGGGGGGGSADSASGAVRPGQPATVSINDATLKLPAGEFLIIEDQGAVSFNVTIRENRSGANVPLDPGETRLSNIYSLSHDSEGQIYLSGDGTVAQAFGEFTIGYDETLLPSGASEDDLSVYVKSNHPARLDGDTEFSGMVTNRVIGEVDAALNRITFMIDAIPDGADIAVVHSAEITAVESDPLVIGATQKSPWETTRVYVIYDRTLAKLKTAVAGIEGSSDAASIQRVIKERVADNAEMSAQYYAGLGFRQANLEFRDVNSSQIPGSGKHMIVHVGDFGGSAYDPGASPFPQLQVDVSRLDDDKSHTLGSVVASIHHEMFHSIFSGYDILGVVTMGKWSSRGINEGIATTIGKTFDAGGTTSSARSGGSHEVFDLDSFIGHPKYEAYASQDFFCFVTNEYFDGSFHWIADDNGVLQKMRTRSTTSSGNGAAILRAYLTAIDDAIKHHSSNTVDFQQAYTEFALNRFWRHNASSRLHDGEITTANTPNMSILTVNGKGTLNISAHGTHTVGSGQAVNIVNFTNMFSGSSAVLEIAGSAEYTGKLTLNLNFSSGGLGSGTEAWVFTGSGPGVKLSGNSYVDPDFGLLHDKLYLLVTNGSLTTSTTLTVGVTASAATSGGTGTLTGQVIKAGANTPVSGATVSAFDVDDLPIGSATTDSAGRFTLADLPEGTVRLAIAKTGFVTTDQAAGVVADEQTSLTLSLIVEGSATSSGGFSGKVIDVVTGDSISGVTLSVTSGLNTSTPVVASGASSATGTFSFSTLPLGVYTIHGSIGGYEAGTWYAAVIDTSVNPDQDGMMSPLLGTDDIRIVLSWPKTTEENNDLDAHLVGYTSGGAKFHLSYDNPAPSGGDASLDLDNTDRFGWPDDDPPILPDTRPETVTISKLNPGLYTYSVHNYTQGSDPEQIEDTSLAESGATVTVFMKDAETGGTRMLSFSVPDYVQTIWQVFEIDGTTGCLKRLDVSKAGIDEIITPFDSEQNGAGEGPKSDCL